MLKKRPFVDLISSCSWLVMRVLYLGLGVLSKCFCENFQIFSPLYSVKVAVIFLPVIFTYLALSTGLW